MDFFIITLILHVCGQLAILKLRIKNIAVHPRDSSYTIGQIVKRHVHLIRLTKAIDDMFNILLMWEIIGVSVVFCLVGYNVLMNSQDGFKINFLIYFVFILGAFLNLYSNYFVGDRLISEVRMPSFLKSYALSHPRCLSFFI
uniref:Odorant receptor 34 n=1 Tax=Sirex nitobei TaxID=1602346 RepID=A0A857NA26_9HYME|nr:odorant receptor 34 [Sirex nitobei]